MRRIVETAVVSESEKAARQARMAAAAARVQRTIIALRLAEALADLEELPGENLRQPQLIIKN